MTNSEGEVRLRVSTDGATVSRIVVVGEHGSAMLPRAAEENVRTWHFKPHGPATFDVTFRYTLLPDTTCYADDDDLVILRLPTEVEIKGKRVMTCDPAVRKHR